MPGNETVTQAKIQPMPSVWREDALQKNQTNQRLYVAGFTSHRSLNCPVNGSLKRLFIRLSSALTAGQITVAVWLGSTEITRNIVHTSADGVAQHVNFKSGKFPIDQGQAVTIRYTSDAALQPAGSIEMIANLLIEQTDG